MESQAIHFVLASSRKYELIEPQLSIVANLCVSCIVSSLQQSSVGGASKKRSYNLIDTGGDINARAAKMRKLDEANSAVEIMQPTDEQTREKCPEALKTALQYLFKLFSMIYLTDELTPNTFFVCKFFKLLHQYGTSRIKPVLSLLPTGLIQSLLRSMNSNDFNYDFILK